MGRGGRGGRSSRGQFLGASVLSRWRRFWGPVPPPARAHQAAPQPVPSGQVPWEEGPETLTGPLSKAMKVLSVPRLKPAEPALQKFIQQVRTPAGPRLSVCPAAPRRCGCAASWTGPSWGAGEEEQRPGMERGNPGQRLTFPRPRRCDPPLVSARGCPRPRSLQEARPLKAETFGVKESSAGGGGYIMSVYDDWALIVYWAVGRGGVGGRGGLGVLLPGGGGSGMGRAEAPVIALLCLSPSQGPWAPELWLRLAVGRPLSYMYIPILGVCVLGQVCVCLCV